MKQPHPSYAILTGDLVGSRRLSGDQLEELFKNLNDLWSQFGKAHAGAVVGRLEVFRGDGWQAALANPTLGVKAAVFLRAAVKLQSEAHRLDTRIGLGLGTVDNLDPSHLSSSNGAAFQLSGEALESLSKEGRYFAFGIEVAALAGLKEIGLPMMDLAVQRWTRAEAVAVMGSLLGWTQETIARHPLAKKTNGAAPTQQAVADALGRVGWKSHWLDTLAAVEQLIEERGA